METYGHDFAQAQEGLRRLPAPHAVLRRGDPVHRRRGRARDRAAGVLPGHQLRLRRGRAGARGQRARGRRADALHGAAAQRRHAARPGHRAEPARRAQRAATRWRRSRWRSNSSVPDEAVQQRPGRVQRRGPALPALWRGALPAHGGGQLHADRRLRPPPGRDGGHARRRARRLPGPAPGAGLPAAPLHAHARLLRGFRQGASARPTRCCWPRSMPPARRRSWPPTAARWRARCAWPARSSRCSSTRSPPCRRRSWTTRATATS